MSKIHQALQDLIYTFCMKTPGHDFNLKLELPPELYDMLYQEVISMMPIDRRPISPGRMTLNFSGGTVDVSVKPLEYTENHRSWMRAQGYKPDGTPL